jgi:hypothetical protein
MYVSASFANTHIIRFSEALMMVMVIVMARVSMIMATATRVSMVTRVSTHNIIKVSFGSSHVVKAVSDHLLDM